jgi:hypothetical protein
MCCISATELIFLFTGGLKPYTIDSVDWFSTRKNMKNFYGMFSQEGDDALEPLVLRAKNLQLSANQIRVMLFDFAQKNPKFSEAADNVVLENVLNAVQDNVEIEVNVVS